MRNLVGKPRLSELGPIAANLEHFRCRKAFVDRDGFMAPRFAFVGTNTDVVLSQFEYRSQIGPAANDNGEAEVSDRLLHAALRHFAQHGLGAAREARDQAEKAFFAGDRTAYDWWIAICRTLDRRIAAQLDYEFDRKLTSTKLDSGTN